MTLEGSRMVHSSKRHCQVKTADKLLQPMLGVEMSLDEDALNLINVAERAARSLLTHRKTTLREVATIAKAIQHMMPKWVMSGHVTFGISHRVGNDESEEMVYRHVTINGESLTFQSGGSVYDRRVGGDSFSDDSIELFSDGTTQNTWNVSEWEKGFVEILNRDAEVSTEDECDESIFSD
jgi:hypothetical protein